MATGAAFDLRRRVLVDERPLLVGMALDAGGINADRQPCLFLLEAAVRIMAIAALHRAFEDAVMKRLGELRLHLVVAGQAELRVVANQHLLRLDTAAALAKGAERNQRRSGVAPPDRRPAPAFGVFGGQGR